MTLKFDVKKGEWSRTDFEFLPSRHQGATLIKGTAYITGGNTTRRGNRLNHIQTIDLKQENVPH